MNIRYSTNKVRIQFKFERKGSNLDLYLIILNKYEYKYHSIKFDSNNCQPTPKRIAIRSKAILKFRG